MFEQRNETLEESLMLEHRENLRQTKLSDGLTVGECCAHTHMAEKVMTNVGV